MINTYIGPQGNDIVIKSFRLNNHNWFNFHNFFDGFSITKQEYPSELGIEAKYDVFKLPTDVKPMEYYGIHSRSCPEATDFVDGAYFKVGEIAYQLKGSRHIHIISEEEFKAKFTLKEG